MPDAKFAMLIANFAMPKNKKPHPVEGRAFIYIDYFYLGCICVCLLLLVDDVVGAITDYVTVVLDPHETVITPTGAPGILQQPGAQGVVPTAENNGMIRMDLFPTSSDGLVKSRGEIFGNIILKAAI